MRHLTLVLAPLAASLIAFAPDLIALWVGPSFAHDSAPVLQVLALGLLLNSLAIVPFGLIQGMGRADITAKFHLLELPLYLLLLWYAVQTWGIVGAAIAWVVRVGLDLVLLTSYARSTNLVEPRVLTGPLLGRTIWLALPLLCAGWLLGMFVPDFLPKFCIWTLLSIATAWAAWRWLLTADERNSVTERAGRARYGYPATTQARKVRR
jgi:O-antigen/teichoic acid export membrane protein